LKRACSMSKAAFMFLCRQARCAACAALRALRF
jgi:hypothetical protein